jgi:galactose mutarotase-like enzyme
MNDNLIPIPAITFDIPAGNILTLNPLGALMTLDLKGTHVLVPVVRGDGKSISTHICTPNFGKEHNTDFGLKQHGNLRNSLCTVIQNGSNLSVIHTITDAPDRYPAGVTVKADVTLSDGLFTLEITHKNTGILPAPVNCGLHCYFNAPKSYVGTKVNGADITDSVETTGFLNFKPKNTIAIPGMPDLILEQRGFPQAVTWVYRNPEGKFDSDYVCIEPVEHLPTEFGKPATLLQPGQTRMCRLTLALTPD